MRKEAREYYQMLNDNGDLDEVFPNSKGSWEEDEKLFIKYYEDNIKLVDDFEHDLED